MLVKELMQKEVVVVYGGNTVRKAAEEMSVNNRGFLPVYDSMENKNLIGVLSNADIVSKVVSKGLDPSSITVSDIMIKKVISISPEAPTSEAMTLMRKYAVKRLPVMENNVLQGIISSNDILNAMIRYKKELLEMAIEF